MRRLLLITALIAPACGRDDKCCRLVDAPIIPPDVPDECAGPGREKIMFARTESCVNDGAVEWCIPDRNNAELLATLATISSKIHCALGGGRANCGSGGQLLCSYPTNYPEECSSRHGQMTPEVWDDICAVAARSEVVEIVPMFAE